MAMVMLGMFALNPVGITGSIVQQLNHGISTGALFLLVGVVYERRHTREISEYGGLSKVMPVYAAVFLLMTMSSIGLPTLNGFIGEFLILQGVFVANKIWAAFACSGVVLGAAYMLYLYQRTMFGKVENPKNEHLTDLSLREFATFAPLIALAIWIGLYPAPFLRRLDTSVQHVIARVSPEYTNQKTASANCDTAPKPEAVATVAAAQFLAAAPCATGSASPAAAGQSAASRALSAGIAAQRDRR
jgi:NADH-quinone oxidoreductase subunit M